MSALDQLACAVGTRPRLHRALPAAGPLRGPEVPITWLLLGGRVVDVDDLGGPARAARRTIAAVRPWLAAGAVGLQRAS